MSDDRSLQRVVYIVSLFPSLSETFIVREISSLIERGVDVRIISLKKPSAGLLQNDASTLLDRVRHPQPTGRALLDAWRAFRLNPTAVRHALTAIVADGWRKPLVALKSLGALFRALQHVPWLREFDPQLLHAHWATYPSTAAWALGEVLGRPFSFTCHAHDIFIEKQLLARKIHEAALAVTISQHNVDWLRVNATPHAAEKLKVIHCGVDMARTPVATGIRESHSMLAVGRLDPVKGFETLIDAVAVLCGRGVEIDCRLVGSGPLEHALRKQALDRGVASRIEFVGPQPYDQIRTWMETATLFVLPSQVAADGNRDGIPVALMEAMASGCPVVSTRVSGIPELIEDNQHGVLVEQRDPEALADAIERLLDSAELRRRLAAGARARIEDAFDARKEAGRLHGLMAEVANGA